MLGKTLCFFEAALRFSGAEGIEEAVHFEVLHETGSAEVYPAPEGLGVGATNPMPPRITNSKAGRCSFSSKYYWPEFRSTVRPTILV